MCLGTPLDKKAMNKYIRANRKDGSIVVWKVVQMFQGQRGRYGAPYRDGKYGDVCSEREGNKIKQNAVHAFCDRKSANEFSKRYPSWIVTRCRIKAKWLLEVGCWRKTYYTLTASHMVMPKYPQKSVSLKRFKAVCKEHGI